MFNTLQDRLSGIFDNLTGRGALSESDIDTAMREVRRALIEADVALEVVRGFIEKVKSQAVGAKVVKSIRPGQMVVKIVNDVLVEVLGGDGETLSLKAEPPVGILMVGLQGSGKTTTTAKIAKRLTERDKKKVLMVSLDTYRPAAQEQLAILGKQINVDCVDIVEGQKPLDITKRAVKQAKTGGYDVLMLDTAGRLHIDEDLMGEVEGIRDIALPHETLLVADALTGQDAVNLAKSFNEQVGVTGIVLTRIDGDGRGGAALSMRAVTGRPIKLMGTSEKLDGLEDFHPERIANRILGMGDVVSLVEKASQTIDADKANKIAARMKKGTFGLDDLGEQLKQMEKLGGMSGVMGMLPGMGKMKKQLAGANIDDSVIKHQLAIISSMTKKERQFPKMLNASRKKRVAAGSGTKVQEINQLVKMHKQMAGMMKKLGNDKGMMSKMMGGLGMGGGMPGMGGMGGMGGGGMPSPKELEKMQAELAGMDPASLPPELRDMAQGLPDSGGASDASELPAQPSEKPTGLPGLGGGFKGISGLPGLGGSAPKGLPGLGGKKK